MSDTLAALRRPEGRASQRLLVAALAVWVVLVTAGFFALWRYKAASAQVSATGPPASWPGASRLRLAPERATLVLFAHPRCACTHATVTELAHLMAREHSRVEARIAVVRPADVPADWDDTELIARAAAIPGASVSRDEGGVEAAHFGVTASGHVVVYDRGGRRLFSGGITSSRGHEGESFGTQRIRSLLTTGVADRADAPVFGCAFDDPDHSHHAEHAD
jgi:hypothetical protein